METSEFKINVDFARLGIWILVICPMDSGFGGSSRWVPDLERVGDRREGVEVSGGGGGGEMLGSFSGERGDAIFEDCGEGVRDSLGVSSSSF